MGDLSGEDFVDFHVQCYKLADKPATALPGTGLVWEATLTSYVHREGETGLLNL